LLIPLGFLGIIGTGLAYYLSIAFANDAYDRELLNSLDSVAVRTRRKSGHILVDLPPYVRNLLRHDNSDRSFYRIANDVGEPILGDPEMPPPPGDLSLASPHFSNGTIRDAKVRIVSLRIPVSEKETTRTGDSVIVQVAETLKARERFAQQLLVSMVLPQLLMIALGGICIWLGVGRGLRSLQILQEAIARRSQFELKPVSVEQVPVEVRPLVMAINDLLERLREDLESQRRFVANAAHQLRTPLAGLKTYIGVIHALEISLEAHQAMEQVDQALNRVTHMVNRLLALAKAEPNSAMAVEHKLFDLNDLAAEATSELVLEALKKEIDLAYEGIEGRADMIGDPSSLRELIMNLVDNAIRYTPKGGHVTVRLDNSKPDLVSLTVEDDGPGIPEEEREHIFERFYRVLGTQVPGTGLGLAIVREIARAHSASIEVLPGADNSGTRFVVNFPRG
jgi:two-component system sensor histidine kinase TctE